MKSERTEIEKIHSNLIQCKTKKEWKFILNKEHLKYY